MDPSYSNVVPKNDSPVRQRAKNRLRSSNSYDSEYGVENGERRSLESSLWHLTDIASSNTTTKPWIVIPNIANLALVLLLGLVGIVLIVEGATGLLTAGRNAEEHHLKTVDAIVTVAMCGFRATNMASSLRTIGEWTLPIYVITDNPDSENPQLVTPIDVRGHHPSFDTEQELKDYREGYQRFNPEIWTKWHKTKIFDLIPEAIESVMFMDADILAERPMHRFWRHLQYALHNPDCELTLYPERWYTRSGSVFRWISPHSLDLSGNWNSGMLILKRNESQVVLEDWGRRIVRPPFMGRDQKKLTESISELGTKLCFMPSRWEHVHNQADLLDRVWFGISGKATFLHMASSKVGIWKDMLRQKCESTPP